MAARKGVTLIEIVVVIAITAILIGLLLGAIQKVRSTAAGLQDKNQLRQVILAGHNHASANEGRIPTGANSKTDEEFYLYDVLPYLEVTGELSYPYPPYGLAFRILPIYISQNDYSVPRQSVDHINMSAPTSLCLNATALKGRTNFASSFPDGTSNTIAISERLSFTGLQANVFSYNGYLTQTWVPSYFAGQRRGNFAEKLQRDVVPVTEGFPPQTRPSKPGVTFQVVPIWSEADGQQLQALQPSGLKVAMLDGSVRTIHPGVSEATFWGLVTPAAGDIAELD